MTFTIIQADLIWENPTANLANFEEKIAAITGPQDLIILPEMFNTGFSMNVSEPMNFHTHKWMKQMANRTKAIICGSVAISENNKKYNRFLFVYPDGNTLYYNKRHLFSLGNEHQSFTAGDNNLTLNIEGFNIRPLVCYDLRFPAWSRNQNAAYDILIYVASWPSARIEAWKTLLKARAIENQCYVIGLNRIGTDGNNLEYNGQSAVFDFEGNLRLDFSDLEFTQSLSLDMEALKLFRTKLPFLADADAFEIFNN